MMELFLRKQLASSSWQTGIPGIWTQELDPVLWTLASGRWTLDSRPWTLDAGFWIPDSGFRTLESGGWILDAGLWTLCATLRMLVSGHQTLLPTGSEQNQNLVSDSDYSIESIGCNVATFSNFVLTLNVTL